MTASLNIYRVSEQSNLSNTQTLIAKNQKDVTQALNKMSSGRKAELYSDISSQAQALQNLLNQQVKDNSYISSISTVDGRLEMVESRINQVIDLITEVRTRITGALNPTAIDKGLNDYAKNCLAEMQNILNAKDSENLYLFGGERTDKQPVDVSLIGPYSLGAPSSKIYTQPDLISRSVPLSDSTELSYDVLASEDAFADILHALKICSTAQPTPDPNSNDYKLLQEALTYAGQSMKEASGLLDQVGTKRLTLNTTTKEYQDSQKYLKSSIANIAEADPYESYVKLIENQTRFSCSLYAAKQILSADKILSIFSR
ncbi:flagellin N-terminal helical domain-containing protein [Candidatus Nucleicultrix amoebiphila]|jgi:flagellin-like hook-associated protein FlgL|uniref:Flagellin N-terminal domain-containing protein n=1 Tax=Candidatus Nucleicultrix amoebiphila FS5 TaxID=1414854 RepID=A0A1W6N445_9PROT|nr:hypothetical protein [Candidatus Nucleicultrix amoebiphila]ARN84528.1 hypothetical protein GQ61_03415 [Candidatus Nucleicultrix amoebiphila FS5]